ATNLERNLFLASQVMDLGLPVVVALNVMDEAEAQGLMIDAAALSRELGVPVVPMAATRRHGLDALRAAILGPAPAPPVRRWTLMPPVAAQVEALAETLAAHAPELNDAQRHYEALRVLSNDTLLQAARTARPAFHDAVV